MSQKQIELSSLKVGGFAIFDGAPCKVTSIQTSRPGKHGHAKARIEAIGILDGVKRVLLKTGHDKIEVPIIEKKSAQVLSISNDVASVMDMEAYETFDLKIPEDLKESIAEGKQIVYWIILGEKILKQVK